MGESRFRCKCCEPDEKYLQKEAKRLKKLHQSDNSNSLNHQSTNEGNKNE